MIVSFLLMKHFVRRRNDQDFQNQFLPQTLLRYDTQLLHQYFHNIQVEMHSEVERFFEFILKHHTVYEDFSSNAKDESFPCLLFRQRKEALECHFQLRIQMNG